MAGIVIAVAEDSEDTRQQALGKSLADLKNEYEVLTAGLHPEEDRQKLAALMLELSAYRAEIDRLEDELQQLQSASGDQPHSEAHRARPGAGPRVPAPPVTARPVPAPPVTARPVPTLPAAVRPARSEPLSLRLLLEGPTGAGVTTVLDQLRGQFRAQHRRTNSQDSALRVDWFDFEAGQFESRPISFQVFRLSGSVNQRLRRTSRLLVDGVIAVLEATPSGVTTGRSYISELLDDQRDIADPNRPALTIFANKSDIDGALGVDDLAAELLVESSVHIVSTNRDQGFLYGFVSATNAAIKRTRRRDGMGLPRTEVLTFETFIHVIAELIDDRSSARPHDPVEPSAPNKLPAPDYPQAHRTGSQPAATMTLRNGSNTFEQPTVVSPVEFSVDPSRRLGRRRRAAALKKLISALRTHKEPA